MAHQRPKDRRRDTLTSSVLGNAELVDLAVPALEMDAPVADDTPVLERHEVGVRTAVGVLGERPWEGPLAVARAS